MYTVLPRASIRRLPLALLGAIAVLTGCGQAPKQTGTDQVPDSNVALAAAKDGKFNTLAWPMVDEILIDWLDGPFALTPHTCIAGLLAKLADALV